MMSKIKSKVNNNHIDVELGPTQFVKDFSEVFNNIKHLINTDNVTFKIVFSLDQQEINTPKNLSNLFINSKNYNDFRMNGNFYHLRKSTIIITIPLLSKAWLVDNKNVYIISSPNMLSLYSDNDIKNMIVEDKDFLIELKKILYKIDDYVMY